MKRSRRVKRARGSRAWLTFPLLVQSLAQHVIEADGEMQIRQRLAWVELLKGRDAHDRSDLNRVVEGRSLVEGLDRLENLGLSEVRFRFLLEPEKEGWLARLRRWIPGGLRGHETAERRFRLAPHRRTCRRPWIRVTMTIRRKAEGSWAVDARPDPGNPEMEGAFVPRFLA